jgi:hypothetical protein
MATRTCRICGRVDLPGSPFAHGRCPMCAMYWRRHGSKRPPRLWARRLPQDPAPNGPRWGPLGSSPSASGRRILEVTNPPREQNGIMDEQMVVAVALEPDGRVMTVRLWPGEVRTVPLRPPVVGADGTRYTAVDVAVARA